MSFLGRLGGAVKGGIGGFIGSGFNPLGAAGGAIVGGLSSGGGPNKPNTIADAYGNATTQSGQYAADDRNRFLATLSGGQDALNASTQAAMSSAMPEFNQNLQNIRESAERRGVSNGEIETNSEGDLASAFQRNIANAAGAQAVALHGQNVNAEGQLASGEQNNYLDLLSGGLDRQQAEKNRKQSFWNSIIGAAGGAAGAYFGSRDQAPGSSGAGGAYGAF